MLLRFMGIRHLWLLLFWGFTVDAAMQLRALVMSEHADSERQSCHTGIVSQSWETFTLTRFPWQQELQLPHLKHLSLKYLRGELYHTNIVSSLPLKNCDKLNHLSLELPDKYNMDEIAKFFSSPGVNWANLTKLECSNAPALVLETDILRHFIGVKEVSLKLLGTFPTRRPLLSHFKSLSQ